MTPNLAAIRAAEGFRPEDTWRARLDALENAKEPVIPAGFWLVLLGVAGAVCWGLLIWAVLG